MIFTNHLLDECSSTNDVARSLAEQGAQHGLWVSTQRQTIGRGRLGRTWQSLEGNLFISLIVRIEKKNLWSWVPLATAIGTAHFLRKKFPKLAIQIKWPNDLYLNDKKLGGILCESVGSPNPFIIVGLGLNCIASPSGNEINAIDLSTSNGGQSITADDIRVELATAIFEKISELTSAGPENLERDYNDLAYLPKGTEIQWDQGRQEGMVEALGESGELKVKTPDGRTISLFAEEVSQARIKVNLPTY
jgi:BirA family biotin operon repressor/biotin-[acetyl-CoA-carboxylase] ligase